MRVASEGEDCFWIEPLAGLGNRMLVLASSYFFSKKYQKKLCILWNNNGDLAADFDDIFETVPDTRVVKVTTDGYHAKPFLRMKSEMLRKKLSSKCGYVTEIDQWFGMSTEEIFSMVDQGVRDAKCCYIKSWKSFVPACGDELVTLDFLKPSETVLQRGKSLFDRIGDNTVGVHIRRTDHTEAIKDSPTEAFFHEMQRELDCDNHCRFFVATDDREVEQELFSRFGEKVFFKDNKAWGRNRADGILDACVDLWALSKCRKILGSKGSTFGMMAAGLGDVPLEVVTRDIH